MTRAGDVWSDHELAEIRRNDPELLAIADAVAQLEPTGLVTPRRSLRKRLLIGASLVMIAVLAISISWGGTREPDFTSKALAAIGTNQVLHVVATVPADGSIIDLATGDRRDLTLQREIWFDSGREIKHVITRDGSAVVSDVLETPQGGFTSAGPIYDCAWIVGHPDEAATLGISCASAQESSRAAPTLEPALVGFLDGYRQALETGHAHRLERATVDGHEVDWLEFRVKDGVERAAIDVDDHRPVEIVDQRGARMRIAVSETMAPTAANFVRPHVDASRQPSMSSATPTRALPLDGAQLSNAFAGVVWAGPSFAGLPLIGATLQELHTTYVDGSQAPISTGLELDYGQLNGRAFGRERPFVVVNQSATPEFVYRWPRTATPGEGEMYVADGAQAPGEAAFGFARVNHLYITVQASSLPLAIAAGRALSTAG